LIKTERQLSAKLVYLPFWFLVLFAATMAGIPWLRWRFSLRTLLIATALVAVGLGVVIYRVKQRENKGDILLF
jgi:hypothetical protein